MVAKKNFDLKDYMDLLNFILCTLLYTRAPLVMSHMTSL